MSGQSPDWKLASTRLSFAPLSRIVSLKASSSICPYSLNAGPRAAKPPLSPAVEKGCSQQQQQLVSIFCTSILDLKRG